MKQLALGLAIEAYLGIDDSVAGHNAELADALRRVAGGEPGERVVYLWGESGSGRSHWLRACAHDAGANGHELLWFDADAEPFDGQPVHEKTLVLADDVHLLDDAGQVRLFTRCNQVRAAGAALLATGPVAPAMLGVRPDLATRLAWGLVFHVHPLPDADKSTALIRQAHARGLPLGDDVANYLMTHWRRDLPSLVAALEALDRSSLEQHRALTIPLLREVLRDEFLARS